MAEANGIGVPMEPGEQLLASMQRFQEARHPMSRIRQEMTEVDGHIAGFIAMWGDLEEGGYSPEVQQQAYTDLGRLAYKSMVELKKDMEQAREESNVARSRVMDLVQGREGLLGKLVRIDAVTTDHDVIIPLQYSSCDRSYVRGATAPTTVTGQLAGVNPDQGTITVTHKRKWSFGSTDHWEAQAFLGNEPQVNVTFLAKEA